jgi:phosphoglycolate phosphatase-like HAD superfamily hydrolase
MIERLTEILDSPTQLYIVTTKEGRFVKQLLQQQGIELPVNKIIGKESKRPKYETLRLIKKQIAEDNITIWFVEDRLPALQQVQQQSDLQQVHLFLADWGYNRSSDRNLAQRDRHIKLLSLQQFRQDFSAW